jgi:hypothetical protein
MSKDKGSGGVYDAWLFILSKEGWKKGIPWRLPCMTMSVLTTCNARVCGLSRKPIDFALV